MKAMFIVFSVLSLFASAADLDKAGLLHSGQLELGEISQINGALEVDNSWVVSQSVGDVVVTGGATLIRLDKQLNEATDKLSPGFFWNDNDFVVRLEIGPQKTEFLMPQRSTLVFGLYTRVENTKRPLMIQGGARTRAEFGDLMELNPTSIAIRDAASWNNFLTNMKNDKDHPLHKLSKSEIQQVSDGAVFKDGGVASLYWGLLEENLELDEMDLVLREIGLSIEYLGMRDDNFRDDMYCYSSGTCKAKKSYSCTKNC